LLPEPGDVVAIAEVSAATGIGLTTLGLPVGPPSDSLGAPLVLVSWVSPDVESLESHAVASVANSKTNVRVVMGCVIVPLS
jgi:hypothetical protein